MKIKRLHKVKERNRFLAIGRLMAITAFLLSFTPGFSQTPQTQVFEEWSTTSSTQNTFIRSVVRSKALGGSTYYYIAGATLNSGYYDMMVSKLNSSGTILWTQTYSGAGGKDDYATDLQVDAVGNVYVCGSYYKNSTDSNNAIVIKYNSAGTQKWTYTFNGVGSRNDGLSAILAGGNQIYAVGTSWVNSTNKYDILQLRLDSSGTQVWENTWNYSTANLNDGATNLYSSGSALWVGGGAQSSSTNYKYALLKVVPSSGAISTTSVTGGTAFGVDKLTDLQQDANGNIYVTGGVLNFTTGYDYKTEKFDSTLTLLWGATYTGSGGSLDDVATGLTIDSLNNVIVTGYTNTTTHKKNYATVKYNSSGTQQWASTYNGDADGNDSATAIVAKGTNVYVTGMSYNGLNYDYYTIKYNSSGTKVWGISWNSASNKPDIATAIAKDTLGNIIVTGQTNKNSTFTTVKYSDKSVLTPTSSEDLHSDFWFTENRGQLRTTDNKTTSIKYYNRTGGNQQQVYFTDTSISYVWAKLDTALVSPHDTTFRVDMKFKGGKSAKIYPNTSPRENYENFFYPYIPDGCAKMKTYDQLIRPSIYTNIDLIYSSNYAGMKYYYVVKPSASATTIKEVYTGLSSISVNGSGDLVITTALGKIQHPKATVWEIDASGTVTALTWHPSYSISGDTVSFTSIGSYSGTQTLIMEIKNAPVSTLSNHITGTNMEWSTHYGHLTQTNPFTSVRADKAGNSYYSGYVFGNGFPYTAGFQSVTAGGWDLDFVKVKPDAKCKFSTYCGGSGFENNWNYMDIDTLGFMYFIGYTGSTDFPIVTPAGAYRDTTIGGAHDAIIGKVDTAGTGLIWSTYFGGSGNELPRGITVTPTGSRIVIIGETTSSNFPIHARSGAYSSSTGQSFIAEFDAQYDTVWSTRFGTQAHVNDVDIDQYSDIFVVGKNDGSNGNLFLTHQVGSYWDSVAVWNAFIARFNTADTVTWCTAFGGYGSGSTEATTVLCNQKGVYMAGNMAQPDTTFPLKWSSGEYIDSIVNTGNPDMFLARFTVSGSEKYCTLYGTGNIDQATNLCSDDNNTIYLVGTTQSYNFPLWATGNTYVASQSASASTDGVIVAFSPYNMVQWSTCYGGTDYDFLNDVAASKHDKLFITGGSQSTPVTFPWNYPNLVTGEIIDTLKTSNTNTGLMARFDITTVTVGINEQHNETTGDMLIFPNPTSGNLTVQVSDLQGEDVRIMVYDLVGQVIMDRKTQNNFGTLQEQLDLENLSNGVYLVCVQVGNRTMMTKKVIKQK